MKSDMKRQNTILSKSNVFRFLLIAILVISVVFIVDLTGGAPNAYTHLIYIPVILSAYYWGLLGGVIVAAAAGVLISPLVPVHFTEAIIHSDNNYVIRLIIITSVGFVTGYNFEKVNKLNEQAKINALINPLTGTYNINKLISDLDKKINHHEKFAIISIKLTNIEQVSKYIEQESADGVLDILIKELSSIYSKDVIYMSGYDEINLVVSLQCDYMEECKRVIEKYSTPFKVNQFMLRILIKIGIYEYAGINESPIDAYNKARIAYEQGSIQETGIYLYDKGFELSRKEFIETSNSLLGSISNNELYLVYQPKINIAKNTITGVEVLTRWDRKDNKPVSPAVFIKLAEDIGFIKEISSFVLDNSFHQILDWNSKGIVLDISINFTSNELLENYFAEWEKRVSENENIIKTKLEIEITERVLSQNNDKLIERIKELRAKGIKISIDDFGTGVNSLLRATQLPYDQIKIDRYFISQLNNFEIRELVREMIDHAHKFGREVVAEGVETEEQLNVLRDLNCDFAQGYYYSKPLLPIEFEQYYINFNKASKKSPSS
jgi:EAL domain-containing protein (putative c-di-GMP-specific phosphodiesterase class I)/GGDEF domain-containing protein